MPDEELWSSFFDVERILDDMRVTSEIVDAADFGCGYGTFTIPAAQRISGILYAVDIEPEMLRTVDLKARNKGLTNIRPTLSDLLREGSSLGNDSVDYVMLFNLLHSEDPLILLREAFRVLRVKGRVGIVHWIRDVSTPRGPPLEMRPTVEQCVEWCREAGFYASSALSMDLKPYHFGLVVSK
ncbi:MAG: class I SAM-dependent methyltransferase [Candidatus Bathyarchaeia archaeon]